jgi:phosphoserine phosphatase RsbU/P
VASRSKDKRQASEGTERVRVLVADDDPVSRRLIQATLESWGHPVTVAQDGDIAWATLASPDAPRMAILDWMMPGMDGPEICRKARAGVQTAGFYLILLSARDTRQDLLAGLEAGANDYLTKPFDQNELRARVGVGLRILELQKKLANRVIELELAMAQVKRLRGLLPICMYCKKIRNDSNYWQQVDSYIRDHSEAEFSHGICPDCYEKFVKDQL